MNDKLRRRAVLKCLHAVIDLTIYIVRYCHVVDGALLCVCCMWSCWADGSIPGHAGTLGCHVVPAASGGCTREVLAYFAADAGTCSAGSQLSGNVVHSCRLRRPPAGGARGGVCARALKWAQQIAVAEPTEGGHGSSHNQDLAVCAARGLTSKGNGTLPGRKTRSPDFVASPRRAPPLQPTDF